MPATFQPTKEQVRAYMRQRQREFERRHADGAVAANCRAVDAGVLVDPVDPLYVLDGSPFFLLGTIAQLATLLAVEWCFLAAGISRSN